MTKICRTDVTDPDCPGTPKESGFAGHLPGTVWLNVRDQLNADEQMGKQHSSLRNATIVSVQRPVLLGDSIVMLAQVSRPVEGAKREMTLLISFCAATAFKCTPSASRSAWMHD